MRARSNMAMIRCADSIRRLNLSKRRLSESRIDIQPFNRPRSGAVEYQSIPQSHGIVAVVQTATISSLTASSSAMAFSLGIQPRERKYSRIVLGQRVAKSLGIPAKQGGNSGATITTGCAGVTPFCCATALEGGGRRKADPRVRIKRALIP